MKGSQTAGRKEHLTRRQAEIGNQKSISPNSMVKKNKPLSPFVSKLRLLLKDSRYYSAIHWSKDGKAIVVSNPDIFKALVLDNVDEMFKTRNFTSFVRQLNLYGFRKIPAIGRSDPMKNMHFEHPHFRRDRPEYMHLVHRTCVSTKKKALETLPEIISPRDRDLDQDSYSNPPDALPSSSHNCMEKDVSFKDEILDMSDESTSQDHDYALPTRNDSDDSMFIEPFDAQFTFDYLNKIFESEAAAIQGLLSLKFSGYCSPPL